MSKIKHLRIRASDLAKITGHNKYVELEDVVNEFLSYNKLIEMKTPKTNIEKTLTELDDKERKILCEFVLPDLLDKPVKEQSKELFKKFAAVDAVKSTGFDKLDSIIPVPIETKPIKSNSPIIDQKREIHTEISPESIERIRSSIIRDTIMLRGTLKEESNLDKMEEITQTKVLERNEKIYKRLLYKTDSYDVTLIGKIDGITYDENGIGTIIESKNRKSRLIKRIPQYEKVQLEAYFYLINDDSIENAILNENYNGESNNIEYKHSTRLWNNCLKNIKEFIKNHIESYI